MAALWVRGNRFCICGRVRGRGQADFMPFANPVLIRVLLVSPDVVRCAYDYDCSLLVLLLLILLLLLSLMLLSLLLFL